MIELLGWTLCAFTAAVALRPVVVWAGGLVEWEGDRGRLTVGTPTSLAVALSFGALGFFVNLVASGVGGGIDGTVIGAAVSVNAPSAPTADAIILTDSTARIIGTAFSGESGDTHDSTQIQLDTIDGDWSSPKADSTSGAVTSDTLLVAGDSGAVLKARMRYKGAGGWSSWSDSLQISMAFSYCDSDTAYAEPLGLTRLFYNNGNDTVLDARWTKNNFAERNFPAADPTGSAPTGRSNVLLSVRQIDQSASGVATADTLGVDGIISGPFSQIYARLIVYFTAGYDTTGVESSNPKFGYFGMDQGNPAGAHFWTTTRKAGGGWGVTLSAVGVNDNVRQSSSADFELGTWYIIEAHLVAESDSAAADGDGYLILNGDTIPYSSGLSGGDVNWMFQGNGPKFDGYQWFFITDDADHPQADTVYIAELCIAGSN